jgi:putative FmdB family regulatory protein
MPIYEYRCEECDEPFEVFVRLSSRQTDPTCPRCGSQKVKKAVSLFGVGGAGRSKPSCLLCAQQFHMNAEFLGGRVLPRIQEGELQ